MILELPLTTLRVKPTYDVFDGEAVSLDTARAMAESPACTLFSYVAVSVSASVPSLDSVVDWVSGVDGTEDGLVAGVVVTVLVTVAVARVGVLPEQAASALAAMIITVRAAVLHMAAPKVELMRP
ncbi:hypothetical protein [Streptomyces europaeiscabiei]|uniref:hypothetical protein n=1 Tax=Streptomyces europaeiscabiei TaxID=146819 RepID=UPI0029B5BF64|nr:hypothetical protein [Streptomyces europaeiscabiei]MDX3848498.1 hypothetical protein [Streptomyces europaeiscabiei]